MHRPDPLRLQPRPGSSREISKMSGSIWHDRQAHAYCPPHALQFPTPLRCNLCIACIRPECLARPISACPCPNAASRRLTPLSGAGSGSRPAPAFLSPPFLLDVFPVRTGPSPGVENENLLTLFVRCRGAASRGFGVPHQYHAPHPWKRRERFSSEVASRMRCLTCP